MSNIATFLKEATNDLLSEEALSQIEEAFNKAVDEKVSLHVEKALIEQDNEYSSKLEKLLEAVDTDHTNKMQRVVEAINNDHANKLKAIVNKYEKTVNEEAKEFKGDLVQTISNYIDVFLEEKAPIDDIKAAVRNKKAIATLGTLRETLGVDLALAQDSIREAVVEGKNQINESAEEIEQLKVRNERLTRTLVNAKSKILLEEKTKDLPGEKKTYLFKVLAGKSEKFINENFDYTLKLFEKTEEERLAAYKAEAEQNTTASTVDRPIVEKVETEQQEVVEESSDQGEYVASNYMDALKKY